MLFTLRTNNDNNSNNNNNDEQFKILIKKNWFIKIWFYIFLYTCNIFILIQ